MILNTNATNFGGNGDDVIVRDRYTKKICPVGECDGGGEGKSCLAQEVIFSTTHDKNFHGGEHKKQPEPKQIRGPFS
jgi:hypothetical protein